MQPWVANAEAVGAATPPLERFESRTKSSIPPLYFGCAEIKTSSLTMQLQLNQKLKAVARQGAVCVAKPAN